MTMRKYLTLAATALLLAGCGDTQPSNSGATPTAAGAATTGVASTGDSQDSQTQSNGASTAPAAAKALGGRTGELTSPDDDTMVFLYYDLAGIAPPIENWVEEDSRVKYAPGLEKASKRTAIRAELESGAAAVRNVGFIRLSMNANLSEYDPTYGEFLVRALAPSSVVSFSSLGQKVELRFANGRTAQIWRVPQSQAQAIRDKIGNYGNVSLDVLLRIAAVQPGPGGGTITTDIVEYDMQTTQGGQTLARVQVAQQ
jgi:hypothetical protein